MFPNNDHLFVEKLLRTKQAEIIKEIQSNSLLELRDNLEYPIKPRAKYKTWVLVGLLIALPRL